MLADIDKSSPTSMEYWFPVLDIFNSGHLSVKDLKLLYHDNLILLVTSKIRNSELKHQHFLRSTPIRTSSITFYDWSIISLARWHLNILSSITNLPVILRSLSYRWLSYCGTCFLGWHSDTICWFDGLGSMVPHVNEDQG